MKRIGVDNVPRNLTVYRLRQFLAVIFDENYRRQKLPRPKVFIIIRRYYQVANCFLWFTQNKIKLGGKIKIAKAFQRRHGAPGLKSDKTPEEF